MVLWEAGTSFGFHFNSQHSHQAVARAWLLDYWSQWGTRRVAGRSVHEGHTGSDRQQWDSATVGPVDSGREAATSGGETGPWRSWCHAEGGPDTRFRFSCWAATLSPFQRPRTWRTALILLHSVWRREDRAHAMNNTTRLKISLNN